MACTATVAEYNQLAEGILRKKFTPLGQGAFGAVYHIGDSIVKRVILIDKDDVNTFKHEVSVWEHLASIPSMRPYMPGFCRALIIDNAPPRPYIEDYRGLPLFEQYSAWYDDFNKWDILYGQEHFAYGFIFQVDRFLLEGFPDSGCDLVDIIVFLGDQVDPGFPCSSAAFL